MKQPTDINNLIANACKKIAPAWPLKNSVAVNPFLGLSDLKFNEAAQLLQRRSDIQMSMPIAFYLDQMKQMVITRADLRTSLNKHGLEDTTVANFKSRARSFAYATESTSQVKVKNLIDVAEELTAKHWNELFVDKISAWAASYFDDSQALWNTVDTEKDVFHSWKEEAQVDLSTELIGVKNFRKTLKQLPDNWEAAAEIAIQKLNIEEDYLEDYLHALLLKTVGWSSYIAGTDWNENLYEGEGINLRAYLSILLAWEYCLAESLKNQGIDESWKDYQAKFLFHKDEGKTDLELDIQLVCQNAYDLSLQRQLKEKFQNHFSKEKRPIRPKAQAVFCIDVRSEVYRRNIEKIDADIETVGFAGFFGFPIKYVPLAHNQGKNQCPVLIPSQITVKESFRNVEDSKSALKKRTGDHQVEKNWKLFKRGAISSFGFVSPLGLSYLPKLISDSFGWTRPTQDPNSDGLEKWMKKGRDLDLSDISLNDKINMAASALTAMGLKDNLAQLVLITGHGSSSVNNPHATGLDCGACGGHSGEINAMTAEKILNDLDVRSGLSKRGIRIPIDTHFTACLHDTASDEVTFLGELNVPETHTHLISKVKDTFKKASKASREERALRMNIEELDVNASVIRRTTDWSQVRPELGLAGCHSFVIAPRNRTTGMNFGGKSFLHSYNWKTDEGFKILESIMTAPLVVTSWINLQYFASTTDNKHFGAGNKTLHNVTGGIGVLEGSAGDLRIGLPMQSIHDGKQYQHLPYRLNAIIEAPIEAINSILEKNEGIRELCENEWITLLLLNEKGQISQKYAGNYNWENLSTEVTKTQKELITV